MEIIILETYFPHFPHPQSLYNLPNSPDIIVTPGKSNSSKCGSKSNSIENSPLPIKTSDMPYVGSSSQPSGTSNGGLQQRRPSKKNRGSSHSNVPRDDKSEKSSKPNQDGRPKFGRSAKVSTNSTETTEVQNNRAFIKDEDLIDLKDISADLVPLQGKPSINISNSPNGNAPQSASNMKGVGELDVNLTLDGLEQSDVLHSNKSKTKSSPIEENISGNPGISDATKIVTSDSNCEEYEFCDIDAKDSLPLTMSSNRPIARKEEWLALRVRRGNRAWPRLPLCFSGSIDSCGS